MNQLQNYKKVDTRLENYPNLQAIISGTISGSFNNWPAVRIELCKLVAVHTSETTRLRENNAERLKEYHFSLLSLASEIDSYRKQVLDFGQGKSKESRWKNPTS